MNPMEPLMSPSLEDEIMAYDRDIPWVPLGEGKTFKPLRFFKEDGGFVELLKLEPGAEIPWHKHTGLVHAYNLQGSRKLDSGEIIGPGDYVFEPPGNVDKWQAVGEVPLVVFVLLEGAVQYVDSAGHVLKEFRASTLDDIYRAHCKTNGFPYLNLHA